MLGIPPARYRYRLPSSSIRLVNFSPCLRIDEAVSPFRQNASLSWAHAQRHHAARGRFQRPRIRCGAAVGSARQRRSVRRTRRVPYLRPCGADVRAPACPAHRRTGVARRTLSPTPISNSPTDGVHDEPLRLAARHVHRPHASCETSRPPVDSAHPHTSIAAGVTPGKADMPIVGLGLHVVIAMFFAMHAVRSGQDRYWLMILFAFPGLGSLVYALMIWLPEMRYTRHGHALVRGVKQVLDPTRELRAAQDAFEMTATIDNRLRLADALLASNRASEAVPQYQAALHGIHSEDPAQASRLPFAGWPHHLRACRRRRRQPCQGVRGIRHPGRLRQRLRGACALRRGAAGLGRDRQGARHV